ncbi:hypothetical protein FQR65_LT20233 [Abscondita terminalis]|nr:hypothetical protein FQR65_LT20233 [Abscondita terminalis]
MFSSQYAIGEEHTINVSADIARSPFMTSLPAYRIGMEWFGAAMILIPLGLNLIAFDSRVAECAYNPATIDISQQSCDFCESTTNAVDLLCAECPHIDLHSPSPDGRSSSARFSVVSTNFSSDSRNSGYRRNAVLGLRAADQCRNEKPCGTRIRVNKVQASLAATFISAHGGEHQSSVDQSSPASEPSLMRDGAIWIRNSRLLMSGFQFLLPVSPGVECRARLQPVGRVCVLSRFSVREVIPPCDAVVHQVSPWSCDKTRVASACCSDCRNITRCSYRVERLAAMRMAAICWSR